VQLVAGVEDALILRRRALRKAQGRRRLLLLCCAAGAVALVVGYQVLARSSAFAVTQVQVEGGPKFLRTQIQQQVAGQALGHSLLRTDAGAVARSLEQLPYVRSVKVDRAFPHTLSIQVDAYQPAVFVRAGGQGYLVASDGRVLAATAKQPAGVPLAAIPAGSTLAVGARTGDANVAAALALLAATPDRFKGKAGHITRITPNAGMLSVLLGKHIQLRLGTPDDLALKLQVAQRVLSRIRGTQRRDLAYLDVSAPSRPALGMRTTSTSTLG
jgi:cell division protein FtsQ